MASFMVYALVVGLLVTLAAVLAERVAAQLRVPRRGIWIAALVAASALPAYSIVSSRDVSVADIAAESAPSPVTDDQSGTSAAAERASGDTLARTSTVPIVGRLYLPLLDRPFGRALDLPLTIVWLGGVAAVALVYFLAWLRLLRAARRWMSTHVDGVKVLVSAHTGPAVFGFARPRIVVPRWLLDAPLTTRAMVLRHEYEHVAARDQLLLLAGLLVCALAPWNFVLWWQLRRLRLALEIDCDARVVRCGTDGLAYARALLAVRERRSTTPLAAIALTEPVSQLERRIRIMLETAPRASKPLTALGLTVAFAALVAACALEAPERQTESAAPGDEIASGSQAASRGRARIESPDLRREPVTGLMLGGEHIAILVDVSASMLDRVPIDAERRRAMSADQQRESPKWRQLVATVDWLTTRIPLDSQFQVIAFNDDARWLVVGTDGDWIDGRDDRALERAVRTLREETLPRGERNLEAALAAASKLSPPVDNLYLLVDGLPTASDTEGAGTDQAALLSAALRSRPPNAPVNVILLPMESEPLAAPSYWTLALETSGSLLAPAEDWP